MMQIRVDASAWMKDLEGERLKLYNKANSAADRYVDEMLNDSYLQVPKDTGALADSQYKEDNSTDTVISKEFGYGGSNTQVNPKTHMSTDSYAVEVHEDLQMIHPHGGKAKYLEDPVNAFAENMEARLILDLE